MHWRIITGNTEVIETRGAMIPLYRTSEHRAVLIDSGAIEDPELISAIEQAGVTVSAVLCTHLHPDHIANNRLLIERFGTKIYATEEEICAAHTEVVEYGKVRLNKSCLSEVPDYPILPVERQGEFLIDGKCFQIIDTPGHTKGHVAYITPDGVCCAGDAMISEKVLQQLKLPYFECVKTAVESMKRLVSGNYPYYVISHGSVESAASISTVVQSFLEKREALFSAFRRVIQNAHQPVEITVFMKEIGIDRQDFLENGVLQEGIKSYLSVLADMGEVRLDGKQVASACL